MTQQQEHRGSKGLKIAVIGAGVAGITATYLLSKFHRVTLYEKNDRLGGHTNTVEIEEGPDAGTPVDTGFIVLNDRTYPGLHRLLREWGVAVQASDMSFSYYSELSGRHFAGTGIGGLFSQRANLLRPGFWRFLAAIPRFGKQGLQDLETGAASGRTLAEYLQIRGCSKRLQNDYILPMGAAIWSTPPSQMREYPAEVFLRFFKNHGLLTIRGAPQWQTIVGGSHSYLKAFRKTFSGEIVLNAALTGVRRLPHSVVLSHAHQMDTTFDHVIIAAHADEALALLNDPSPDERELLGAWNYQPNRTILHTDAGLMPPNRRAWASWNYRREKNDGEDRSISVTYHMNRLQNLQTTNNYCVTLNTTRIIDPSHIIASFDYTHPLFTFESIASQKRLRDLNGTRRTWFCGSYFRYGFHEDAVQSAMAVVKQFEALKQPDSGLDVGAA